MPRPSTYPPLFDRHAQRLTIGDLGDRLRREFAGKTWGEVEITHDAPGGRVTYRIALAATDRHFGGHQWFFICPATGKRCRVLYRFGDRFACRDAYPRARYSIQNLSKLDRRFAARHRAEAALSRPGLKRTYAGKPTRRYQTLAARLDRATHATLVEMARIMNLSGRLQ